MIKRSVRLKETPPHKDKVHVPPSEYLEKTDGSLAAESFHARGTINGFLDTEAEVRSDRGSIFVVGDSFVESIYAQPQERFVARAAHALDANVLNAGYSGMTSLQQLVVLMTKIAGLAKPGDSVVLFTPNSDSIALSQKGGYWTGNSKSYYSPLQPPVNDNSRPITDDDYRAILRAARAMTASLGIGLVLATSPFRDVNYAADTWLHRSFTEQRFKTILREQKKVIRRTCQSAKELQIPLFDLNEELGGEPALFYDRLHLNSAGQELAGELFTNFLRTQVTPNLGKPLYVRRFSIRSSRKLPVRRRPWFRSFRQRAAKPLGRIRQLLS